MRPINDSVLLNYQIECHLSFVVIFTDLSLHSVLEALTLVSIGMYEPT